jgi:hypothetical protein
MMTASFSCSHGCGATGNGENYTEKFKLGSHVNTASNNNVAHDCIFEQLVEQSVLDRTNKLTVSRHALLLHERRIVC